MKQTGKANGVVLGGLALALGAAIYLNWSFSQELPQAEPVAASVETSGETWVETSVQDPFAAQETAAEIFSDRLVYDPLAVQAEPQEAEASDSANKNYGEAQLVSVNKDSGKAFFEQARLSRSQSRDEALDHLKKSLKQSSLTAEEKDQLTQNLQETLGSITKESNLENIIKAKGFADCMVYLEQGKAQVTVMTERDALTPDEVTQIRDILLEASDTLKAQDITIVEVK